MRIWVDLANSPHPLLFAPVAHSLQEDGHELLMTARDHAQTLELARERWPEVELIGGASPAGKAQKLAQIGRRVAGLRRWAAAARPQVALSHNSYAQIVAARSLRIPAVTAMDFERQPANHIAFRLASTVLLPSVLPIGSVRGQGAKPRKVLRYQGLKENLYIWDFEPDPTILARVGLDRRPRTVVVARTPPTRALYHSARNPLFEEALRAVCSHPERVCVVLARHPEQVAAIEGFALDRCVVLSRAVDARSLMYAADAMIGAGGTMTREAALLGIPTWTAFAGPLPAVDEALVRREALEPLSDPQQLADLGPRPREPRRLAELRASGEELARIFVEATVSAGALSSRRGRGSRPGPSSASASRPPTRSS